MALLFIALLFHYPRLFFIADQASQVTGRISLLENYAVLCKWDCGFYHYLADQSNLSHNRQFAAFFPLFPMILKICHKVVPNLSLPSLSIIVSNVFSFMVIAFLVFLGSGLWPNAEQKQHWNQSGLLLAFFVAIYPYSQFFSYGYPEPLFLLLYAGAILSLRKDKWFWSALCCGLAAVVRAQGIWILGVFVALGLVRLFLRRKDRDLERDSVKKVRLEIIFSLFIACLPFSVFLFWQWHHFGSPFAFLKVQTTNWGRSFEIIEGLKNNIPKLEFSRIFNALAIYSTYRFISRRDLHWKFIGISTLLMTEIPLFFGGFLSYGRFSALNIGVFIMLVEVTRERFWLFVAIVVFLLTRLNVEIHNWLTLPYFIF